MSPCLQQMMLVLGGCVSWEAGGLSWGFPLRGFLLSGQAWSYFMSCSFGKSTPGRFSLAVPLPGRVPWESSALQQLTAAVPCSPAVPGAVGRWVLQVVPKGK